MGYTQKWWHERGDTVLGLRKKRYAEDEAYREAVKARSREYRERKRAELTEPKPELTITINGVTHPALSSDDVCQLLGFDRTRLKYLQKAGYLPLAKITRPSRVYTKSQVTLIRDLDLFLQEHKFSLRAPKTAKGAASLAALQTLTAKIATEWEN